MVASPQQTPVHPVEGDAVRRPVPSTLSTETLLIGNMFTVPVNHPFKLGMPVRSQSLAPPNAPWKQ